VISIDTARRQAKVLRHGLLAEVTVLIAHGLLHLCGYDHEVGEPEARRMLHRERALLRAVGIERDPLTFRRV
jgi:rRNA maturation RNase YbeY